VKDIGFGQMPLLRRFGRVYHRKNGIFSATVIEQSLLGFSWTWTFDRRQIWKVDVSGILKR
jgi:hypothetical protein